MLNVIRDEDMCVDSVIDVVEMVDNGLLVMNVMVIYCNGYIVLWNVSFDILCGMVMVFVGVNGVGKFILFKVIMGFFLVV